MDFLRGSFQTFVSFFNLIACVTELFVSFTHTSEWHKKHNSLLLSFPLTLSCTSTFFYWEIYIRVFSWNGFCLTLDVLKRKSVRGPWEKTTVSVQLFHAWATLLKSATFSSQQLNRSTTFCARAFYLRFGVLLSHKKKKKAELEIERSGWQP